MPGAFEGETITRRRFMTGTAHGAGAIAAGAFALPALGFAIGPIFKSSPAPLGSRWGTVDEFSDTNYVPVVITLTPEHRRGGQDHRVRAQVQPRNRHRPLRPGHAVHRDLQPLRAPRLPGALGGRRRALHLPVPRRRLRPARAPRRRAAGAAARPLLHARQRRKRRSRVRASASTASCGASRRATPASRSTASASTCTPRAPARRNSSPAPRPRTPCPSSPLPRFPPR